MSSSESTSAPKRGLVLAGGGAKGAYEFGFLKAFQQWGVRFQAVAGTSVGALNAAIWSTGRLDKGAAIWENLSQKTVYPFRILGHLALLFVSPSMLLGSHFDDSLRQPSPPLARGVSMAFSLFAAVCFLPSIHHATYERFHSIWLALGVDVLAYIGIGVVTYLSWMKQLIVLLSIPAALVSLGNMVYHLTKGHGLGVVGVPDLLPQIFCISLALALLVSRLPLSAMGSEPLKRSIEDILKDDLAVPIYVTTGTKREYYDPDHVFYYELRIYGSPAPPQITRESRSGFFPEYHRLQAEPREAQLNLLLASAALPFGIVPAVTYQGRDLVDGGVVDNVPRYPLIEFEHCDELVVLTLDSSESDSGAEGALKDWQRIHRLFKIRNETAPPIHRDFPPRNQDNDPPRIIPYEQPGHWPKRILSCRPSEPLGGFRDGTLNFDAEYAKRLIALGERDADAFIRRNWPELVDGSASR